MSRVQGLDWEPLQIWEQGPASTPSTGPLLVSEKKCFFPFYLHYNHLVLRVSSSLFAFPEVLSVGHSLGFTTGAQSWLSASGHEPLMTVHRTVVSGPQGTDYNLDFEQQRFLQGPRHPPSGPSPAKNSHELLGKLLNIVGL